MSIVADYLFWWPDYLHTLNTSITVPELLDNLFITQDHDSTLGKYWLPACRTHAKHNIVHNPLGEFPTFKRWLYIPKNWYQLYYIKIMILMDILGNRKLSRWLKNSFIGYIWWKWYEHIAGGANYASYLNWIHRSWLDCTSHYQYCKYHWKKFKFFFSRTFRRWQIWNYHDMHRPIQQTVELV